MKRQALFLGMFLLVSSNALANVLYVCKRINGGGSYNFQQDATGKFSIRYQEVEGSPQLEEGLHCDIQDLSQDVPFNCYVTQGREKSKIQTHVMLKKDHTTPSSYFLTIESKWGSGINSHIRNVTCEVPNESNEYEY